MATNRTGEYLKLHAEIETEGAMIPHPLINDLKQTLTDAGSAMRRAEAEITRLRLRNERLVRFLEDIYDRAKDKYDGPEDMTHGPYLAMAEEALGIHP